MGVSNVVSLPQLSTKQEVYIHPSSCLFHARPPPQCVMYTQLVHTTKCYMRSVGRPPTLHFVVHYHILSRDVSVVDLDWLAH